MPDIASAEIFLDTLNHCHPSAKFTMEVERNASLPFIGVELLNWAPRIKTTFYVKPTNTGLLLHYQSRVDNRYKRSLVTTMWDRAYRISSDWSEDVRLGSISRNVHLVRHKYYVNTREIVSLRNRTEGRRGRQNACVWQMWQVSTGKFPLDLHLTLMFSGFSQKDFFKGRRSLAESFYFSNKIIAMLVTQGLPSSFLFCRVA